MQASAHVPELHGVLPAVHVPERVSPRSQQVHSTRQIEHTARPIRFRDQAIAVAQCRVPGKRLRRPVAIRALRLFERRPKRYARAQGQMEEPISSQVNLIAAAPKKEVVMASKAAYLPELASLAISNSDLSSRRAEETEASRLARVALFSVCLQFIRSMIDNRR